MDFLPFPLFASLCLFAVGLCDFLYGINKSIATACTVVFAVGVAFLFFVNSLRLFIPECPYHLPIPLSMPAPSTVFRFFEDRFRATNRAVSRFSLRSPPPSQRPIQDHDVIPVTSIPKLVLFWIFVSAPVNLIRAIMFFPTLATKLPSGIRSLATRIRGEDSGDQTWKAAALAWLIQSSSRDEVVTNALDRIPAASQGITGTNPLCKREIFDILLWRFLSTSGVDVGGLGEGLLEADTGRQIALDKYLNCLRLLFGDGIANDDDAREYFNVEALQQVAKLSQSDSLTQRLISGTLLRSISYPIDESKWWADVSSVAQSPELGLGGWFHLFLIRVVTDEMRRSPQTLPAGLSSICQLMESVEIDEEYSEAFLTMIASISQDSTAPPFQFTAIDSELVNICYNSVQTGGALAEALLSPGTVPAHRNSSYLLRLTSTILLKILRHRGWGTGTNLDIPDVSSIASSCNPFINWVITDPSFSVETRISGVATLTTWLELYANPLSYEIGSESDLVKCCGELMAMYGTQQIDDDSLISAVSLVVQILERDDGGTYAPAKQLLEFDIYPSILAIIRKGLDAKMTTTVTNIIARVCWSLFVSKSSRSTMLAPERVNDPSDDAATALYYAFFKRLLQYGLRDAIFERTTDSHGSALHVAQLGLHLLISFPEFARSLMDDDDVIEGLIHYQPKNGGRKERTGWGAITVLVHLSHKVLESNNEELKAKWFAKLVKLKFPLAYSEVLAAMPPNTDNRLILWDLRSGRPVLQEFYKRHRENVLESSVLYMVQDKLAKLASQGFELQPWETGMNRLLKASEVLREVQKFIESPEETGFIQSDLNEIEI